jgi:DNA-binding transcriptional MerR regulator
MSDGWIWRPNVAADTTGRLALAHRRDDVSRYTLATVSTLLPGPRWGRDLGVGHAVLTAGAVTFHAGEMSVSFNLELDVVVRASDRPTYNTAAVEQQTGLRPATFRAWERRYGFPKPRRLPGNQRLYSDQDIEAIRWLQRRTDEGLSISHAIRLLHVRLREGIISHPQANVEPGRPTAALADDLTHALLALDAGTAEQLLSEAFSMYRVEEVCLAVLAPTLVEVGERWHSGEISVVTEHFASSFVRCKLFSLFNVYESGRGRGLVFASCAPDEWHEIGILMISLFLVRRGIRLSYLGPNISADDGLAETLQHHRPDLLIVSATSRETADRVDELASVVSALPEPRPNLGFGGHGFDDEAQRQRVPGTYLGPDAGTAVRIVEHLLSTTTNGAAH